MNYLFHLVVLVGIYLPLVYSLNLMIGFGRLVLFCHAAFYGIGAYGYAILAISAGLSPRLAFLGAILLTALSAIAIGQVALRFRGELFLFVSLGFQMIVFAVLHNCVGLTRGPYGISGIPRPEVFGIVVSSPLQYAALAVFMNLFLLPLIFALYRSPFGRTLRALGENEVAAEALGIDSRRVYFQALVVSAVFAAVSGVFYAAYVTYIDPTSFTLRESIFLVAILLLGGSGNRTGPFLGTLALLLLPEVLRFLGLPDTIAYNTREIIYGLLLILLMYFRPRGIAGEYNVV